MLPLPTSSMGAEAWAHTLGTPHINMLYGDMLKKDAGLSFSQELAGCVDNRED